MTPNEARAKLAEIIQEAGADISVGLFQQTIKFADEGDHTDSPENIEHIKQLYFDPVHACDVAAKKFKYWRYDPDVPALTAWVAYNSPGFYHTPEESPNVENYRRALNEAQRILSTQPKEPVTVAANDPYRVADGPARLRSAPSIGATIVREIPTGTALVDIGDPLTDADGHQWRRVAIGGPVGYVADELLATDVANPPADLPPSGQIYTFDPTTPTELQRQDWTCSIRSTMWMLKSIGIAVTADEAQDAMSPAYVNSDVGLLDASGAGIVEVLRDHWGVEAHSVPSLSFDEAMSLAGQGPLAIGLRNWGGPQHGHWSAVRGKDGDSLVLANPAGPGPAYGQQTLDRAAFDARGTASAVFIPIS